MHDGEILETYLRSKRTNRKKFADTLKMSKQNLYQLFESRKMQPETKASLEAVIGLKWDKIQQAAEDWVNIDGNVSKRNGIQQVPDYRDEVIALLKEKLSLIERKQLVMLQRNQALLNAIVETLPKLVSKGDKAKLLEAHEEMNKRIERHLDVLKKENT